MGPNAEIAMSRRVPSNVFVVATSTSAAGFYELRLENQNRILCVSRQPFLDGARKLLALGYSASDVMVLRDSPLKDFRLRALIGRAAKLTVDEHNGTVFAKWKGIHCSAGSTRMAANNRPATTLPTNLYDRQGRL